MFYLCYWAFRSLSSNFSNFTKRDIMANFASRYCSSVWLKWKSRHKYSNNRNQPVTDEAAKWRCLRTAISWDSHSHPRYALFYARSVSSSPSTIFEHQWPKLWAFPGRLVIEAQTFRKLFRCRSGMRDNKNPNPKWCAAQCSQYWRSKRIDRSLMYIFWS